MRPGRLGLRHIALLITLLVGLLAGTSAAAVCESDSDCADRNICVSGTCQAPRRFGLIYSHQPGPDGHRVVIPFYFHYWKPSGLTQVVFPLFFRQKEYGENPYSDLVIPLLLYQRRQEPGIDSHRVWPLFFYSRYTMPGSEGKRLGLLPLFFAQQRGDKTLVVLPPLIFGHSSNRAEQTATTVAGPIFIAKRQTTWHAGVLPLLFVRKSPDATRVTLFPLLHVSTDPASTFVMATPLFWHHQTAESSFTLGLPLFYQSRAPGRLDVGVLPLFFYSQREQEKTFAIPPLLLGHSEDPSRQRATTVAGPIYVAKREATWFGGVVPLLFVRKDPDGVRVTLFPLLHVFTNSTSTLVMATPLLWHHQTADSSFTLGLPLFYQARGPGRLDFGIPPLFFYSQRSDPQRVRATLVPLFHISKTPTETLVMATPLVWHHHDAESSFTLGLPLFYDARGPGRRDLGLVPLLFYARREHERIFAFPALLAGHSADPENQRATTVTGPVYVAKRGTTWYGGVVPLLFVRRDPQSMRVTLFPLLHVSHSARETLVMATPLIWHHHDAESRFTLALPLFYDAKGPGRRDVGLLPLFFLSKREHETTWAVPALLLGHSEDPTNERATTVAGPIYAAKRGTTWYGGMVPFLFVRRDPQHFRLTLFPLFHISQSPNELLLMATPLIWHHRDAESRFTLALPLFYDAKGPGRRDLGVLPLFFLSKREHETTWAVPALLLGHSEDPTNERATTVAGPVYAVKRGTTWYGGVFPLLYLRRDPQHFRLTLFPLFHISQSPNELLLMATPLIWHHRDQDSSFTLALPLLYDARGPGRRDLGVVPLFFLSRRDQEMTWAVPPLLLGHSEDPANQRATTVAGPVYALKRGTDWSVGVVPFVFVSRGLEHLRLTIFPLFHYSRSPNEFTLMATPLIWHHRDPQSRFTLALPLYYDVASPGRRDLGFVPLFFLWQRGHETSWALPALLLGHSENVEEERATTVAGPIYVAKRGNIWHGGLVPFLFVRKAPNALGIFTPLLGFSRAEQGYYFYLGPLYVRREGPVRTTAILPLFWDHADEGEGRRTTLLLPLFIRHATSEATTLVLPALLTYLKLAPGSREALVFPFVYHAGSSDRSTTIVFPLIWNVRRPDYHTLVVAPLFVFHRSPGSRTLFLPPLLTLIRWSDDGSRSALLFPLFYHATTVADRSSTTVVFPLFYHLRRPTYQATIFFPLGAHWRTQSGHYTLVLNTFYVRGVGEKQGTWQFRFFPLFGFGRRPRPQDLEWSVLEGLVGYQRLGRYRTLRLFWIPIALSDADPDANRP